jgi:hypothetical protein
MKMEFRRKWLQVAALIVMAFGPAVLLAAHPATAGINGFLVDLMFWPVDGNPALDAPATRLLSAISGGLLLGWGTMIWLVARKLYPREPELARSIILSGLVIWFVADSAGSMIAGAPLNAALNVLFLLMFWIPLSGASNRELISARREQDDA